jgi:hypothetical protein
MGTPTKLKFAYSKKKKETHDNPDTSMMQAEEPNTDDVPLAQLLPSQDGPITQLEESAAAVDDLPLARLGETGMTDLPLAQPDPGEEDSSSSEDEPIFSAVKKKETGIYKTAGLEESEDNSEDHEDLPGKKEETRQGPRLKTTTRSSLFPVVTTYLGHAAAPQEPSATATSAAKTKKNRRRHGSTSISDTIVYEKLKKPTQK